MVILCLGYLTLYKVILKLPMKPLFVADVRLSIMKKNLLSGKVIK